MTRLRHQSALTQTITAGGCQLLADSGREELEALPARVPFTTPSSCWDIWARRMTVAPAESGNKNMKLPERDVATVAANSPVYKKVGLSFQK